MSEIINFADYKFQKDHENSINSLETVDFHNVFYQRLDKKSTDIKQSKYLRSNKHDVMHF